jgi:hypothetical protein
LSNLLDPTDKQWACQTHAKDRRNSPLSPRTGFGTTHFARPAYSEATFDKSARDFVIFAMLSLKVLQTSLLDADDLSPVMVANWLAIPKIPWFSLET